MAPRWAAVLFRLVALPGRDEDALGDLVEMRTRWIDRWGRALGGLLASFATLEMAVSLLRQRIRARGRRRRDAVGKGDRRPADVERWSASRAADGWIRDFALAARSLGRARGFTLVVVLTLAIAIGSNTMIFSVVESVLLDPLPFPAADRLVSIRATAPGTDRPDEFDPAPEFYLQYRANADMLEAIGMYVPGQATLRSDAGVDRLFMTQNTADLFTTLGARPQVGRLPTAADDGGSVMVLSDWVWRTRFGADPAVVGRSYEAMGAMREVIGVTEPDFRFPDARTAVWLHQTLEYGEEFPPGLFGYRLVARARPGVAPADLEPQLAELASRLPDLYGGTPEYARIIARLSPLVRTLEEQLVGDFRRPLWLLMATVGIVLLIACANVANLFSVRAETRRRNLDVRYALGAGRAGLIRVQMAEALLLAALGGLAGVALSWVGLPVLLRAAPETLPNLDLVRISGAALGFTASVTVLAALAFGLAPALRFSRPRPVGALRQSGSIVGRRTLGRDALVLAQTASALVLLVGAGLLLRSFHTLSRIDPGFDTEDIFTFQVAPDREELSDGVAYAAFHEAFMERIAALPGVESVGLANTLPLDEGAGTARLHTEASLAAGREAPPVGFARVGGDYFGTMGIAVQRGRAFEPQDHDVGPVNVLVSSSAAELYWPGEEALGQRLRLSSDTTHWATVVGIVEDVFLRDLRQSEPDPMVYLPLVGPEAASWAVGSPAYVVKSARADLLAPEIRELMREVMPESPMYRVSTMQALAERSMAQLSFTMTMLLIAAGLALTLGAIGLYGILSYVVSGRAPEIAVRMALGAEAARVRRMVVAQGARITLAGVLVGIGAALLLTRALESLLFGVDPLDVPTFVTTSLVMVGVALLASYLPARRASNLDPVRALTLE